MPEVSAEQLARYRSAGALLDTLAEDKSKWKSNEDRLNFLRAARTVAPGIKIPEDDIAGPLLAPLNSRLDDLAKQNQELLAREAKRLEDEANAKAEQGLQATLARVQRERRLTSEGMELVVKRMKEFGNMDADSAASYVIEKYHSPEPTGNGAMAPGAVDVFQYTQAADDDSMKRLSQNPEKWFDSEVRKVLGEFRDAGMAA